MPRTPSNAKSARPGQSAPQTAQPASNEPYSLHIRAVPARGGMGLAIAGYSRNDTFVAERGSEISLRWVCVPMTEEYTRHNGHAGRLREFVDGTTGF